MSDRHDLFGEPNRRASEQRTRIPLVQMRDDDGNGGQRPPGKPPAGGGKRRKTKLIWAIAADILIAALLFAAFYATNVMEWEQTASSTPEPPAITSTPTPAQTTPTPTVSIEPTPTIDPNDWRAKFKGKFTTGEVIQTDTSYQSANVNVRYEMVQKDGMTYHVIDIYVADLKCFQTAFAKNKFSPGHPEYVEDMGKAHNAIAAINGDYCTENAGPVLRNGVNHTGEAKWSSKYKDPAKFRDGDVLFMYRDGSMKTLLKGEFTMDMLEDENLWQAWTFGPQLLQDGQPKTKFNSTVATRANPRTAIGYYEPGHYCFVNVEGRVKRSKGMTMSELSKLFAELGCKEAFNLDGGGTAQMAFLGERINDPAPQFRRTADMIYITDTLE